MKTFLPKLLGWALLILLVTSFKSHAENLYVDAGGNNTANNCKGSASPCETIQYALTQAIPGDVIIAIGNLTAEPMPLIITKSITIRGAQSGTKPILRTSSPFGPENRGTETRLRFTALGEYIYIKDGVNDVTIEGFEFISTIDDLTQAIVIFEEGSIGNNNIVVRRNIFNGNSSTRRRFILKDNIGGSLTNIKIIENRILGLSVDFPHAAIDIRKAGTGVNEIRGNVIGTASTNINRVQKGINLSNVTDFIVAGNEFRSIMASPIEIGNTNPGGKVIIEYNNFINSNAGGFINEIGPNSPIAAGIILRANIINSDSLIIRNNDFQGDNKIAIAIPEANNNFTTNSIQIVENRFSTSNIIGNSVADIYTGNNLVNPTGKISTDGNYWGTITSPSLITGITGSVTTDILGGANVNIKAAPFVWLINSTDVEDITGTIPGFVSNKIITFNGDPSSLQNAFDGTPEGWTFRVPASTTGTYPGPFTIKKSFVFDAPSDNIAFGNLVINAPGKIISLNKTLNICTDCNGTSTGSLTLTAGKIELGSHNIYIKDKAAIIADNQESYIITNGTGKLIQTGIGSNKTGIINFPVGPDEISFTPVTINNTGTMDDFSVSVVKGISRPGNNGAMVIENAVDLTWDISEATPGGSNVTLTLQWNAGDPVSLEANDEQLGFDRTLSYIAHYNSTSSTWENLEWPGSPAQLIAGTIPAWKKTATGVNNFSPFGVGGPNAPLPVNLINFSAKLQFTNVDLSWTTASEKDNAYFAIERSGDGKDFSEIGRMEGQGTIDGLNTYNFTDHFVSETGHNLLYYRLKQVDTNGKYTYSKIQHIQLQTWGVSLFPNPAHQFIKIASSGNTLVEVINSQGQVLIQKEFTSGTTLDLSSLIKGIYIFRFYNGEQVISKKVSVL